MDDKRAKAFMSTMIDTLNAGSIALMISIGHRTGLFDVMAGVDWVTSIELAQAAELDERYVREWLAAMASAGIVDYDADGESFSLPEEHQTLLTRAGGPLNMASQMQTIAHLGASKTTSSKHFEPVLASRIRSIRPSRLGWPSRALRASTRRCSISSSHPYPAQPTHSPLVPPWLMWAVALAMRC